MADFLSIRGGSWDSGARDCRCASRDGDRPDGRYGDLGFRVMEDLGSDHYRAFCGGSWIDGPRWLRSAYRDWNTPSLRLDDLGFRVVEEKQHD